MEIQEQQIILRMKSEFLDSLDIDQERDHYESLIRNMLHTLKRCLRLDEVTFIRCNKWKQQLFVEASTSNLKQSGLELDLSCLELEDVMHDYSYNKVNIPFPIFQSYDYVLRLNHQEEFIGLLLLKVEDIGHYYSEALMETIAEESSNFVKKAYKLSNIVVDEKRYRQLYRVTDQFHSSMNMDGVLGEIIQTLREVYPDFTYYLLLSHDNHNHGDLPIKELEYDSENMAAMQSYVTGTVQFEDSMADKRSILYAPLKGKQGVYGVLQVIAPNTVVFPKSEVEFITLLANTAGGALENAQLYQQSRRLVADLQLINETSHRLNTNLRLNETLTYMIEQILTSFNAKEVGFMLLSENEQITILPGSTDFFETTGGSIYIDYIKEKIKKEKDSLFIGDLNIEHDTAIQRYRSIMAIPMVQSSKVKGFSIVMHSEPYHFSFENFKLLQSLIHHSTLAFTNSILREELEKMVITDNLTKLYTRNYLDERIHQSLQNDDSGTFILIDIDNFKRVNDTYGHQIGDDILIQVANLMKQNIRGTDIAARWGGEELAIYLPRVNLQAGVVIAERIVRKVAELSSPHVTISCGVSYWYNEKNDSVKSLFKRADDALYEAKETGKNRVVIQPKEEDTELMI